MNNRWTRVMENFLRDHANEYTDKKIMEFLNELLTKQGKKPLTLKAVRRHRQKLGLFKACGRGKCEVTDYGQGY